MLDHLSEERRDQLAEARPERQITLFYDQAIECLHIAISAVARGDIEERCNATTAAIELLSGMLECMNPEDDDEIGINICRIHGFIIARLPRINVYNDTKFAAEAVRLLKPLRDAFAALDRHSDELQQQAMLRKAVQSSAGRPSLSLVTPTR